MSALRYCAPESAWRPSTKARRVWTEEGTFNNLVKEIVEENNEHLVVRERSLRRDGRMVFFRVCLKDNIIRFVRSE